LTPKRSVSVFRTLCFCAVFPSSWVSFSVESAILVAIRRNAFPRRGSHPSKTPGRLAATGSHHGVGSTLKLSSRFGAPCSRTSFTRFGQRQLSWFSTSSRFSSKTALVSLPLWGFVSPYRVFLQLRMRFYLAVGAPFLRFLPFVSELLLWIRRTPRLLFPFGLATTVTDRT
jgi:hypothetical protein